MSLPPVTIKIKRKATDDPVEYLRVHEPNGKRQRRATEFVFSRHIEEETASTASQLAAPAVVRPIKQIHRSASFQLPNSSSKAPDIQSQQSGEVALVTKEINVAGQQAGLSLTNVTTQSTLGSNAPQTPLKAPQPRRFHISRSTAPSNPSIPSARIRKRTTVFVERRTRPRTSEGVTSVATTPALTPDPEHNQPQKKPGLAARTTTAMPQDNALSHPAQLAPTLAPRSVRLPSGLMMPWDVDDEQLAKEMQAYTLQEIGHSIAEADATEPGGSPTPAPRKKQSKFKPKQIPRYHERHPEVLIKQNNEMEIDEYEPAAENDDDSEWVEDIYYRVAADDMEIDSQANIGLLVLDSQPDIDEFYSNDQDSDDEEEDDEEDENAENHYSADYPDEEVDSDDEYGRNPYRYANRHAEGSDVEDYDDDLEFSDEGNDATKYPWSKKPLWLRKAEAGIGDEDSQCE